MSTSALRSAFLATQFAHSARVEQSDDDMSSPEMSTMSPSMSHDHDENDSPLLLREDAASIAAHLDVVETHRPSTFSHEVEWKLTLRSSSSSPKHVAETHTIALRHGLVIGKRRITVDGVKVHKSARLVDSGSSHRVSCAGVDLVVLIEEHGVGFRYNLLVDDLPVSSTAAHFTRVLA